MHVLDIYVCKYFCPNFSSMCVLQFNFMYCTHNRTLYLGFLGLTFSSEESITEFPFTLGPAKGLGIFDSSFTAMAFVYTDVSASSKGDYPIFGNDIDIRSRSKALHLQACLSTKRT